MTVSCSSMRSNESIYTSCDNKDAEFLLSVDLNINGVTTRHDTCHFRHAKTNDYVVGIVGPVCSMDTGNGNGYVLSYDLLDLDSRGAIFRVSCSYNIGTKHKKFKDKILIPWLKPIKVNRPDFTFSANWTKKEPNHAQQGTR